MFCVCPVCVKNCPENYVFSGYSKAMTDNKNLKFAAILTPNHSLQPKGFAILMTVVAAVSFTTGVVFILLGAWPVFGFLGLDVALLYWAFKQNYADGEKRELVEITDRELIVQYFAAKEPVREYRFNLHWVRLELIEDKARELIGSLIVYSHGKRIEIASFLGPDERKEFYRVLNRALNSASLNR